MSAKSKRRRVRKTVQRQTPTPKTWAERARANTWVFVMEVAAIAVTLVGFGAAVYGLWEQIRINQLTVNEIKRSQEFRENTEAVLAQKTFEQMEEDARAREQEALARNWALLTTHASGNSGKGQALEYLASKHVILDGIDLSCKTMGGMEKDENGQETCERPTYLVDVDLSKGTHGRRVFLRNVNLSDANLIGADLSGAELSNADLSGAELSNADLSGANLSNADLSGATLLGAVLNGATLSDTSFTDSRYIGFAYVNNVWAWANHPPIDLDADIDLCVSNNLSLFNNLYFNPRPDPCIPPEE